MTQPLHDFTVGDWCWFVRQATPCRVVERQDVWGEVAYRVWLPAKNTVVRARAQDLDELAAVRPVVEQILHTAAAAKLLDALEDNLLLAPIQSSVVPLPHQLYALNRAMSRDRIRYLLADEVGLGKTIEAGLILRELKLRGMVRRVLVVAPKGLIRQWQAEMRLHFGEHLRFIEATELAAFRAWRTEGAQNDDNLWSMHDQVIVSLDSVKPIEGRRGWSLEQLNSYNRERFEDLVSAGWDLVIIDESHRMGGSTEQVARYKLGAALAETAPYLLLLSATPHQGKTDQFLRLMQLLDREVFPDEASIHRDRVHPFVIRTEKRSAIGAEGQPLFKPRSTRLQAVAWQSRHAAQKQLYDAVTDYVRHGYNQAMAAKQRHIGFLMILMQRLVTSSTAAIRATLEKREALLDTPQPQTNLFDSMDLDEWAELDGQSQLDAALQASNWEQEKAEVKMLLDLARETERQGTDAKAEALLELIYKLQQEENTPELKVLVFTEFVPTQAMLAEFLESRGFSVTLLNGGMDLDVRTRAQQAFSRDVRVLISTDAGGEGLNLQFCHVIVNFDMPWNPMRLEQRIGRVDRIGQPHVVRAINFVLEDTVEHRVREVLEQKLEIIAQEFGVDKAADVMDSVEVEPLFDELFVHGLQDPASIDKECDAVINQVREKVAASRADTDLLADDHPLEAVETQKWRDHPAQYWLERAVTTGLPTRGGAAEQSDHAWRLQWADGSESFPVCFDARTAEQNPEMEWITLEDPRARALIGDLPRCVADQPLPVVQVSGLPQTVQGTWSLWSASLAASNSSANFTRRRFLPVFVTDDGRSFVPTAKRIWDLLLTENVRLAADPDREKAAALFEQSLTAAKEQGERLFSELLEEHRGWLAEERERARYAFESRFQAIGRIGLPAVREHRRKRLQTEHQARMANLAEAEDCTPELNAVLILRIGPAGRTSS
ncbi:helicase [Pseudomonas aeruginosa]|uniref:DEAD/DEAH box helicase n=1 Tax=Pseudomonas aeruginosa TaxID=287 RepID=UPI002E2A92A5|nr:helicase-related protein [Pseudomonas aeruginosa]MCO2328542.1 helicase [Pseudomonas aeruginosa]MCS8060945.1 helicase-related protein [Pseudomonas aeruginosa]HBP4228582.1 DEAD/DEAH box helicase family protein [Pseudomonas aeruginosa]HBP4649053.1 DEAD/DEAH box helicase family protein [Pseudomonas aeruginosa]HBP4752284.1 DEAD/DEAH box helicase family protein [Pseudomonas aeruginosa]